MNTLKTLNHVTYNCNYHIVWTPKYRKKLLIGDIKNDFIEILKNSSIEMEVDLIEFEVMPDHIHILVSIPPQLKIGTYLKKIKGNSSRFLRNKYKDLKSKLPSLWTHSYFVSTVGNINLHQIKKYIEEQETQYDAKLKYGSKKK
jgi:putative transposase